MPQPRIVFNSITELRNYINTFIIPDNLVRIRNYHFNNIENGILDLIASAGTGAGTGAAGAITFVDISRAVQPDITQLSTVQFNDDGDMWIVDKVGAALKLGTLQSLLNNSNGFAQDVSIRLMNGSIGCFERVGANENGVFAKLVFKPIGLGAGCLELDNARFGSRGNRYSTKTTLVPTSTIATVEGTTIFLPNRDGTLALKDEILPQCEDVIDPFGYINVTLAPIYTAIIRANPNNIPEFALFPKVHGQIINVVNLSTATVTIRNSSGGGINGTLQQLAPNGGSISMVLNVTALDNELIILSRI